MVLWLIRFGGDDGSERLRKIQIRGTQAAKSLSMNNTQLLTASLVCSKAYRNPIC